MDSADSSVREGLRALLDLCDRYMPPKDLELVHRAFRVAERAHAGAARKSGEPYITHPLAVARTLAELAIDAHGVAAALLHDTVEDTSLTREDIEREFGTVVADIVDGVTKFTEDEAKPTAQGAPDEPTSLEERAKRKKRERSATMRKLLLAMRDDPRVVLVKLSDRLHNLRTLDSMNAVQKERTARETLDTYGPLASRIGLYAIKNELEDLAYLHTEPEAFERVSARLRDEVAKRSGWADRVCRSIEHALARDGVVATVNWRIKRAYRAHAEASETGVDLPALSDLIAFRVLVTALDDCYRALAVIHSLWTPYRYRDYIASPKINGYQSFHTAVFALDGRLAQLHIRTHLMHRTAQHGIAAYWLERAAQGRHVDGSNPVQMREMVGWVSEIMNLDEALGDNPDELLDAVQSELLHNQIYVNTPKGDTVSLPEGATVLDLAYKIHTEIGDHTIGAFLQYSDGDGILRGRTVRPEHVLQSGDIVRIHTSKDAYPTPGWLDLARTHYARQKITRSLRLRERQHEQEAAGLGGAGLTPRSLADGTPQPLRHPDGGLAEVQLARCCCPMPGDAIAGLAQPRQRVAIHRICCRTLAAAVARRWARGSRHAEPLRATWAEIGVKCYWAPLVISGQDHPGLMHEVSKCAETLGLGVTRSFASANTSRYRANIAITLEIPIKISLEYVAGRLRRIPGVVDVERDTAKGCSESRP